MVGIVDGVEALRVIINGAAERTVVGATGAIEWVVTMWVGKVIVKRNVVEGRIIVIGAVRSSGCSMLIFTDKSIWTMIGIFVETTVCDLWNLLRVFLLL
jgi:hypothetical protein